MTLYRQCTDRPHSTWEKLFLARLSDWTPIPIILTRGEWEINDLRSPLFPILFGATRGGPGSDSVVWMAPVPPCTGDRLRRYLLPSSKAPAVGSWAVEKDVQLAPPPSEGMRERWGRPRAPGLCRRMAPNRLRPMRQVRSCKKQGETTVECRSK